MADDPTPGGAGETPTPTPNPDPKPEDTTALKAALEAERKSAKDAKAEAKAATTELETLRAEKRTRDEAELSEKEKAEKRATDAEAKAAAAELRIREQATRYAIAVEGGKLNIVDIEAAYLLVTVKPDAIQYGADGTPTNAEALLKDLIKNKPYLVKPTGSGRTGVPDSPPGDDASTRTERVGKAREELAGTGRYSL